MAITSPFRHYVPLSSSGQPVKPILPTDADNTFAADQDIATQLGSDSTIYQSPQVEIPKGVVSTSQAESMSSLVTTTTSKSVVEESLVYSDSFDLVSGQIDYIFTKVVSHPGYGSCSARVVGQIQQQRSVAAKVVCQVNYLNSISAPASGAVTTFQTRTEVTAQCDMTVANSSYKIIGYRWRNQDAPNNSWAGVSDGDPFAFDVDHYYNLAVRIRLSPLAPLIGSDWTLQYSATPQNLSSWNEVVSGVGSKITILPGPYDPPILSYPTAIWPVLAWVTSPGPGTYQQIEGGYAEQDNQSVRSTAGVTGYAEIEMVFCLYFFPDLPKVPYYFRIVSQQEQVTIEPTIGLLAQPWITEFT